MAGCNWKTGRRPTARHHATFTPAILLAEAPHEIRTKALAITLSCADPCMRVAIAWEAAQMHELSICQSVLQTVKGCAAHERFSRVIRVRLEIGCFGGVEPDALRFGFDVVTKGTIAEGAALDIIELPGVAWCCNCSENFEVTEWAAKCPACHGNRLSIKGGNELRIKDLEVI